MNLSYRRMTLDDIPQCHALSLHDRFAYDDATFARIPDFWRQLLIEGNTVAWVVEDQDCLPESQIMIMEILVFITDEFTTAACTGLPPYTGRNFIDFWLTGRSPILDLPAVRAANSGSGLNSICLHTVTAMPPDQEEFRPIHDKNFEAYRNLCMGYNYKQMLLEVYGQEQMKWNLNAGFRLRSDYSEATRRKWTAKHAADREPYLLSTTREEAAGSFGTFLAVLFQYARPRFYFNSREQELLETALTGLSDDEAAGVLCLSHAAIRKRWESLYGKVLSAAPALLGDTVSLPARRGLEKRRRLLAHLREHPEELRPVLPPK